RIITVADIDNVMALSTDHRIHASAGDDGIIAKTAGDRNIAAAMGNGVAVIARDNCHVRTAHQSNRSGFGKDILTAAQIDAGTASEPSRFTLSLVVPCARQYGQKAGRGNGVVAVAAVDVVRPAAADDGVHAIATRQAVITRTRGDGVATVA